MSSNLNYTKTGDYFLPNLTLKQPRKQLNRYGRMRRNYLMEQRPVAYSTMLLNGTLYPHLWEMEQTAENRMQQNCWRGTRLRTRRKNRWRGCST